MSLPATALRELEARWPYLTAEVPAVPLLIRHTWEDFHVREIPLREPDGEGDHLLLEVEKKGISTASAVRDLARVLRVRPSDIGVAGLKDTRAVTVQRMSVEHVSVDDALAVKLPRVRVLDARPTRRKLRTGQLAGNAFSLVLRTPTGGDDVHPIRDRLADIRAVLDRLSSRGIPNYFGPQRFGMRGDNQEVGRALLAGDFAEAAARIAGRPGPDDTGDALRARELYERGDFRAAAAAWPRGNAEAARVASARARGRDDRAAVLAAGKRLLRFHVSALQSALFNDVLAARIESLDRLGPGDVAWEHATERVFLVEDDPKQDWVDGTEGAPADEGDPSAEGPVSPTGPLFGPRMKLPAGAQAELEERVLLDAGLDREAFARRGAWGTPGGRRPLRIPGVDFSVEDGADAEGDFVRLCFTLPSGAYATGVLRELAKGSLRVGTAREWEASR